MALSFDWPARIVSSDASIVDLASFHAQLRDAEDSEIGVVHPVIHTWRALDLGGGAFFYQTDFINGWRLRFPVAGNYEIRGNLNADIVPVVGVFVERKTSAAYVTTSVGSSGPSAEDIAAALLAAMNSAPPRVNVKQMNDAVVIGDGSEADPWRGAGVQP